MKEDQIIEREGRLREASAAYYNKGISLMPDEEFDRLMAEHRADHAEHKECYPSDSIIFKVGSDPAGRARVSHPFQMLSLDNIFEAEDGSLDELDKWVSGILEVCPYAGLVGEPKADGLAVRLGYMDGCLIEAVTRGNGFEGDDVLPLVLAGSLAPSRIDPDRDGEIPGMSMRMFMGRCDVIGEVVMDWQTFHAHNAAAAASGGKPLANPRNAAAGAMGLKSTQEFVKRGVRFIAHGVVSAAGDDLRVEKENLRRLGFEVMPSVKTLELWSHGDRVRDFLREMAYPCDGAVIKVTDAASRKTLGQTSRAPRWAIALKLQPERVVTTLRDIVVQVGRTGALAPVADLEPVFFAGSTVARATLCNEDQINRLNVRPGDRVILRKAAEVIPEVIGRVGDPVDRPKFDLKDFVGGVCPDCGSFLRRELAWEAVEDGDVETGADKTARRNGKENSQPPAVLRCANRWTCKSQVRGSVELLVSRNGLDVNGIGEDYSDFIAERLIRERKAGGNLAYGGLLSLLGWSVEELADMVSDKGVRFGRQRAIKARSSLDAARRLPLHRWVYALGIPSVGVNTSKELSRLVKDVDELGKAVGPDGILRLVAEEVPKTDPRLEPYKISSRIGPVSARMLCNYFESDSYGGSVVLGVFRSLGVVSENYNPVPKAPEGPLAGLTVVLTGEISVDRQTMTDRLIKAGAKVTGSVSKKTNMVLAGENCGQKLDKARALGIRVVSEEEIEKILNNG